MVLVYGMFLRVSSRKFAQQLDEASGHSYIDVIVNDNKKEKGGGLPASRF